MKILVICTSSIGDIVLATPVVRILKSELEHEVHYLTRKEYQGILEANPYLDQIHTFERKNTEVVEALKRANFDAIVDIENNFHTKLLKLKLRKKTYSIKTRKFREWLLIRLKINLLGNAHIVERYLKIIEPLGAKMDSLGLDYFIPEKDEVENDWLPETHREGYAVLVLAAKFQTKKLPANRLIELCDRINKPIILIGGSSEAGIGNQIESFFQPGSDQHEKEIEDLNKKASIFNACGKFSINQFASLISKSNWVFTHDTDMMHIASAFKKPIFSIWGNSVPEFGWYPYRTQFTIFENKNLNCRPCSVTGFDKCPKGHFKCMNDLSFDFYLPD